MMLDTTTRSDVVMIALESEAERAAIAAACPALPWGSFAGTCSASAGWACTRPGGHEGPHVAHTTDDSATAVWWDVR